jgi:hypothetical protein
MVVDDASEAARMVAEGRSVVLLLDVDATLIAVDATLIAVDSASGAGTSGPGRVAVFVGSPADPASWQAARAMALELFGPDGS